MTPPLRPHPSGLCAALDRSGATDRTRLPLT
jgi:hypothetical protein